MKINMTRTRLIITAIVALVVIALGIGLFLNWDNLFPGKQEVSTAEPIDVVLDFYDPWLSAWKATTTDPYKEGLANTPILSPQLRKRLTSEGGSMDVVPDLVTCQSVTPPNLAVRIVSQTELQTQILVLSTQKEFTEQAVVTLRALDGGWYIDDIACSAGEFAPEREFSFEREGYLLKSVPPPYNPNYWHIVFEENGEKGHAAPLFFTADSNCTALDGKTTVCNPDQFREATKVLVKGAMTELGVQVKKLELVK